MGFLGLGKTRSTATGGEDAQSGNPPPRSARSSQLRNRNEAPTDHRARGSRRVVAVKPAGSGSHSRRQGAPEGRKAAASVATDELDLAAIAAPPGSSTGRVPARGAIAAAAADRPAGPCRSGDGALIAFLTDKAALIAPEQAETMRQKADAEQLPLDVAGVRLELFSEEQLVNALTQECWVPHLKVDKYEIRKKALDTIAQADAEHYGVFPVDKLGSLLTLAMVNPLDADAIRALEARTGLDIKKVVATRSEINQAIDRYYGGKVAARDATMAFTQDVEPRSVTQMMANVGSTTSAPAPAVREAGSETGEIQDIDDLLSADDAIAPAIIDAVPLVVPAAEVEEISGSPTSPALEALAERPAAGQPGHAKAPALEFDLDYESGSRPVEPTIAPPTSRLQARQSAAVPGVPTTRTSARSGAGAGGVVLVPVMEDEFRHAITHGKAHVFEKWIGLQTRNRIINASLVEGELEPLLPRA